MQAVEIWVSVWFHQGKYLDIKRMKNDVQQFTWYVSLPVKFDRAFFVISPNCKNADDVMGKTNWNEIPVYT
jgi:hypothetical protein